MLLEDLIKELKRFDDKDIIIELSGIIETNIELKQTEIDEKDKYLISKEKQFDKPETNALNVPEDSVCLTGPQSHPRIYSLSHPLHGNSRENHKILQ